MNCVVGPNAKLLADGGQRHAVLVALDGLLESLSLNQSVATSHAPAFELSRDRSPVLSKAMAELGESGTGQVGLGQLVEIVWLKPASKSGGLRIQGRRVAVALTVLRRVSNQGRSRKSHVSTRPT